MTPGGETEQETMQRRIKEKLNLGVSEGCIKASLNQGVLSELQNQSQEIKKATQKIQSQTEKFETCKETYLKGVTDEIDIFNENFLSSVKDIEDKLSDKVMTKLEKMCHKFESIPEAQKEYFIKKLQEKALRERLAKIEEEVEKAA